MFRMEQQSLVVDEHFIWRKDAEDKRQKGWSPVDRNFTFWQRLFRRLSEGLSFTVFEKAEKGRLDSLRTTLLTRFLEGHLAWHLLIQSLTLCYLGLSQCLVNCTTIGASSWAPGKERFDNTELKLFIIQLAKWDRYQYRGTVYDISFKLLFYRPFL